MKRKTDKSVEDQEETLDYTKMFSGTLENGVLVALRRYRFFVFKDGGKEESKKTPSSSSVKCYFVRTESSAAFDQDNMYILENKSLQEARSLFMHVHMLPNLSKYMARLALILSKSVRLDIDMDLLEVQHIDDVPCKDEHGDVVRDHTGEPLIHTDGTGYISEDLARKCPRNIFKGSERSQMPSTRDRRASDDPPLLIQFRLFHKGLAAKGTLLLNKKLPPNTIQLRPSLVKVEMDKNLVNMKTIDSFVVVNTCTQPKEACLSKYLIALLNHGGVPTDYFMGLLEEELNDTVTEYSLKPNVAFQASLMYHATDYDLVLLRMLSAGLPFNEPYLNRRLSKVLLDGERNKLKEGKIHAPDSFYLMGTADPTGKLLPNQVCIILERGPISGDVLVYKHPGLHFGDIHVLTATYVMELDEYIGNLKFAIFFSVQGPRSVTDEMANSDLDGDMYWVSQNKKLLELFKPSEPWQCPTPEEVMPLPAPKEFSAEELEKQLFKMFLDNRFNPSYAKSEAANSWLAYMDRVLTLGDNCSGEKKHLETKMLELTNKFYEALDAPKNGLSVEVPPYLKCHMLPHFMEKPFSSSYHSGSVLGSIYAG